MNKLCMAATVTTGDDIDRHIPGGLPRPASDNSSVCHSPVSLTSWASLGWAGKGGSEEHHWREGMSGSRQAASAMLFVTTTALSHHLSRRHSHRRHAVQPVAPLAREASTRQQCSEDSKAHCHNAVAQPSSRPFVRVVAPAAARVVVTMANTSDGASSLSRDKASACLPAKAVAVTKQSFNMLWTLSRDDSSRSATSQTNRDGSRKLPTATPRYNFPISLCSLQ